MVVAAPPVRRLEGPAAGDDRPGGHELVEDLAEDGHLTRKGPLVQAFPAVAEPVARSCIGPAMNPSRDMDM